jgi:peptidoglycan hydrolase CwlO-like protein
MQIHIHHHHEPDPSLLRLLMRLNNNMEKLMSDVDDFVTTTLATISSQKTQLDSVVALLASIKNKLADALAGESLSPAAKTKLAAIMPALEANTSEISDAITANTDAAPAVAPTPTPTPATPAPTSPSSPFSAPSSSSPTT